MHKVSIVIVSYNVRHFLAQCLDSINKADKSNLEVQVYVVDNKSVDGTALFIQESFPEVHFIANMDNVGFSKANNQALNLIKDGYILILNPDTVIQENTLQVCVQQMNSDPNVGAIGVKMIDGAGNFLPESKRGFPSLWATFCKISRLYALFPNSKFFNQYYFGHVGQDKAAEIDVLCGAFIFTSAACLQKVGVFDPRFFMYGEDIDLSIRIQKAGYKVMYNPSTTIIHFKGESTKRASFNYIHTFYNAMALFVDKHYSTTFSGKIFALVLRLAISLIGFFQWLKGILSFAMLPLVSSLVSFLLVDKIKDKWAEFYFDKINYYDGTSIHTSLVLYLFICMFWFWFFGYFDTSKKAKSAVIATFFSLGNILMLYALLPAHYHTSRSIIFITVLTFLVSTFLLSYISDWITAQLKNRSSGSKIIIVGNQQNCEKIAANLQNLNVQHSIVGYVNAENEVHPFFINTIQNLAQVVEITKANEVIFSSQDISIQRIMDTMATPDINVKYMIANMDSQAIIGSADKKQQGSLYHVESAFRLNRGVYIRSKQLFDFVFSLLLIVLFPIAICFKTLRQLFYKNLISVLAGSKTWVGVDEVSEAGVYFAGTKSYVINAYVMQKIVPWLENSSDKDVAIYYAKHYDPILDLKIIAHACKSQ